ncbi:phosphatase PAP2 family protein [Ferrimonas senticii]|uniref:phosphatase PAP2 family protein n=1 Tax=Ferrimonas senticii TaxID=394566 RepID=UPI0003FE38A1|nr:phosphatase PAP2 family protein [Ferrimonas senticii]
MWRQLDHWDQALMRQLQHLPQLNWWRTGARWLSLSGDGGGYLLLTLLLALLGGDHGRLFLQLALIAFAIELPLYWLLKNTLKRARPCHALSDVVLLFKPHDQFSLPSGHSAAAVLFASLLGWYWPPLMLLAFAWAALVALSRVVLGVHYLSDVLAGALLGMLAAQLSFWLMGQH